MRLPTNRLTRRLAVFGLAATALGVMVTSVAAGGPFAEVLTALGVIDDNVDSLVETQAEQGAQLEALADSVDDLATQTDIIRVEIVVHEDFCAGSVVACVAANEDSMTAASSANHNPVRAALHVTRNGLPVAGLTLDDIVFQGVLQPAIGPTPALCQTTPGMCGGSTTLSSGFFGIYSLLIHPPYVSGSVEPNWAAGEYAFSVVVLDADGKPGYGMGTIEITE